MCFGSFNNGVVFIRGHSDMEVAAAPCNPSTVQSRARNYWISLKYTDEHQWEVLFGKTIEIEVIRT